MSAIRADHSTSSTRGDLRLRMVEHRGRHNLDGGWWPYSRDLIHEITDLVRHFPDSYGRITRALYSRLDWDTSPRRVDLGTRVLEVGSFADDDTHVLVVRTASHESLTLLVIPPGFTTTQGEEALLAASTPGNRHTGSEVLREVTDTLEVDPFDEWTRLEDGLPHRRHEFHRVDPPMDETVPEGEAT